LASKKVQEKPHLRRARAGWLALTAAFTGFAVVASVLGVVVAGPLTVEAHTGSILPPVAPVDDPAPAPAVTASPADSSAPAVAEMFDAPDVTVVPPPPPKASSSGGHGSTPAMLAFVNSQRAANGLAPLTWSSSLASKAQAWSNSMAATDDAVPCNAGAALAHNPNPPSGGENVAQNYMGTGGCAVYGLLSWTASLNVADSRWMASPGHRANILNPSWTRMGGGGKQSAEGVWYWTQDFQ